MNIEYVETDKLDDADYNPRTMSDDMRFKLKKNLEEFGFVEPLVINADNTVIGGHQRLRAARDIRMKEVPCFRVNVDKTKEKALNLALNKLSGEFDLNKLPDVLLELQGVGFDLDLTGFGELDLQGFDFDDVDIPSGSDFNTGMSNQSAMGGTFDDDGATGITLAERFIAPPLSVLDTRRDYWIKRRRQWLELTGNLTDTKEAVLGSGMMEGINGGSSNFDPVLAEFIMRWFCPEGGSVIDPFGGEQTKGVVAGHLGIDYHAVEFRDEQVQVNRKACAGYPKVNYTTGDSSDISKLIDKRGFDLCFTSPPYYDLEIYSKGDMSSFGTYDDFMQAYQNIFKQCVDMMADDGFVVVKIGEIRDKKTGAYRNFVGDNISIFIDLGLTYYNEVILINSFGTAPIRSGRLFKTRKMAKVHQNILVFVKGSVERAAAKLADASEADILKALDCIDSDVETDDGTPTEV